MDKWWCNFRKLSFYVFVWAWKAKTERRRCVFKFSCLSLDMTLNRKDTKASVRSSTAHQVRPTVGFIPKVLDGVEVRAPCRTKKTTFWNGKSIPSWSWFCARGHCHVETGKRLKLLTQRWRNTLSKIWLYDGALLELKDPNLQKQTKSTLKYLDRSVHILLAIVRPKTYVICLVQVQILFVIFEMMSESWISFKEESLYSKRNHLKLICIYNL